MFTRIRHQPKHVRNQYAFWSAIGFTSIFAGLWFVSLQHRLDSAPQVAEVVTERQRGAFAQFVTDAKSNFANVVSANTPRIETVPAPEASGVRTNEMSERETDDQERPAEARTKSMNTRTPFSLSASLDASSTPSTVESTGNAPREIRVTARSAASSTPEGE